MQSVANAMGADWAYQSPADVMREIAEVVPGLSRRQLRPTGGRGTADSLRRA